MAAPDEFELIEKYFAPLAVGAEGAFGLKDDAAILSCGAGEVLVVTSDCLVEGVHFRADDPADLIARKLLRVNLSDLAAMGARPKSYTLSIALPDTVGATWLAQFAAGLAEDQRIFGVSLIGGDTVASPGPLTLSVTAIGEACPDKVLRRDGASPGQGVFVSGTIGDALLGLALLDGRVSTPSEASRRHLAGRYRLPEPRVALGRALVGLASAAIDVSDGLIADLGHVSAASGVAIEIELDAVPLSAAAAEAVTGRQPLRVSLLAGGDDYELALAAPESAADQLSALGRRLGVLVTRIGRTSQGAGVVIRDHQGHGIDIGDGGYQHFRAGH